MRRFYQGVFYAMAIPSDCFSYMSGVKVNKSN